MARLGIVADEIVKSNNGLYSKFKVIIHKGLLVNTYWFSSLPDQYLGIDFQSITGKPMMKDKEVHIYMIEKERKW